MQTDPWQTRAPDLIADVTLYPSEADGRQSEALLGWGCPCFASKDIQAGGWDARLQLGDTPFHPGTERRVGFVFLSGQEAADALKQSGRFYLWEGRFVGVAVVVG